jgi:hypothetical protein
MTAPVFTSQHPTEETLAEYVDNLLAPAPRHEVTQHLVECGECREIVLMASDLEAAEQSNVRQGAFGAKGWIATVAALAVAASVAIFVLQPSWLFGPKMQDVVEASQGLTLRQSDGRWSGESAYRPRPRHLRGNPVSSQAGIAQLQLLNLAVEAEGRDPYVHAMALLLSAEKPADLNAPIEQLRALWKASKPSERDAIGIDYAAALLARGTDSDIRKALRVSEDVLARERLPKALWNRAVALGLLGRDAKAIAAWDDYLKADPSSEWSKEAEIRRDELTPP